MILAADLGSTNFKAAVYDTRGERLAEASRPLPYLVRTAERAELDPEAVLGTFMGLIDDVTGAAGTTRAGIERVAITSQAQTFCICTPDGKPLSPLLGWSDARATGEAGEIHQALGGRFHATTGFAPVSPLLTLSKALWWHRRHGVDPGAHIVLLPSYLAMALGAPHAIDANLAAMSGFYAIPANDWWDEPLRLWSFDSAQLPRVVAPGEPVPVDPARRAAGFSEHLEIVFAGNDHTAGAVGCGCNARRAVLTLGTAGVFYRWAGAQPGPFSDTGLWGPWPGGGYYELLCLDHACSALDRADEYLFGRIDTPRFAAHAAAANVTAETPFFDPRARTPDTAWHGGGSKDERACAAFEGITLALRAMLAGGIPEDVSEVVLLGGGSRIDFWAQMLADSLRRPLARSTRDGLDGAALQAGALLSGGDARMDQFFPEAGRAALLDRRFAAWNALFARHG
jgi:xylulokinase